LAELAQAGVSVVVTVDCGIGAVEEAEEARRLGLELIVTDHHEPRGQLPAADAVVHPRLPWGRHSSLPEDTTADRNVCPTTLDSGEPYPFGHLAGSGVAFKLAWALAKKACGSPKVTPPLRDALLDGVTLAALGTVADVVPLTDENRIFARHGLGRLRQNPTRGLQALLAQAGLAGKSNLDSMDIGFALAPRLNAAGRLGTARLAVGLLTTPSTDRAGQLARYLEDQNQQRQTLERRILSEARVLAEECNGSPALVLASAQWHPGLVGIVASRLVDLYGRPALMIALRDE